MPRSVVLLCAASPLPKDLTDFTLLRSNFGTLAAAMGVGT